MKPQSLGHLRASLDMAELLPQWPPDAEVTPVSGDAMRGCVRVSAAGRECYLKYAPRSAESVERFERSSVVAAALFDRSSRSITPEPMQLLLGESWVAFASAAWPGERASVRLRARPERRHGLWRELGVALARLHALSRALASSAAFKPFSASLEAQFLRLAEEVDPGSYAASVLPQLREPILAALTAGHEESVVHGDCSLHNWIWHPEHGLGAIDFELCTRGDRHFDFAVLFKPEPDGMRLAGPEEIACFEEGYGAKLDPRWLTLHQSLHYLLVLHAFSARGTEAGLAEPVRRKILDRYSGFLRQLLATE